MHRRIPIVLVLALAVSMVLAACGVDDEPTERTFSLSLSDGGEPVGGAQTFKVTQGDTVTIEITSTAAAEIHLHGYDNELDIEAGAKTEMTLTADVTGRFIIEEEGSEVVVGYLEVAP